MKIGAEDKKKLMIMVVLLAIAIPLILYSLKGTLWGSESTPSAPSAGVSRTTGGKPGSQDIDPNLRLDILEASRNVKYEGGGRNIFQMEETKIETIVNPRPTPTPVAPGPQPDAPLPPPPPIPIKFYGFANKAGEPKKIFLAEGERLFVARQDDIIDRRYKVIQIQANSVLIEDMLNNNRQPIPLTPQAQPQR